MFNSTQAKLSPISQSPLVKSGNDKYFLSEPISKKEMYSLMLGLLEEDLHHPESLTTPELTKQYLHLKLAKLEHEVFSLIYLDTKNHVIAFEEMFRGTIDGVSVYVREVVKSCLNHNAAALIMVHAHPSGIPEPSRNDIHITNKLKKALELIEVQVLDHFVVGGANSVSMAERGLI